jgi:hypothetical protein
MADHFHLHRNDLKFMEHLFYQRQNVVGIGMSLVLAIKAASSNGMYPMVLHREY